MSRIAISGGSVSNENYTPKRVSFGWTSTRIETFNDLAERILADFEKELPECLVTAESLKPYVQKAIESVSEKYRDRYEYLEISTSNIAIEQFLDSQLRIKAKLAINGNNDWLSQEDLAEEVGVSLTHLLVFKEYERYRLGALDVPQYRGPFDATYDLARYLESGEEIGRSFPSSSLVLCDELHDMNEASFTILKALLSNGSRYFVGVGDRDQVIHATYGADSAFMRNRFQDYFPGQEKLPLTATFRHGPHLSFAIANFKGKHCESGLPIKTTVVRRTYPDGDWKSGSDVAIQEIDKWVKDTGSYSGCAILIRDKHQSIELENALAIRGIGYRCKGMVGYLQRYEILFLRGMLAIALNDLSSIASSEIRKKIVESLVLFGEIDLSNSYTNTSGNVGHDKALDKAKDTIAKQPEMLSVFFDARILKGEGSAKSRIISAVEYAKSTPPDFPAGEALRGVVSKMGLHDAIRRIYVYRRDSEVVSQSIEGFLELASKSKMGLRDFHKWIGGLEERVGNRQYKEMVTIECVETSKGTEYPHVILPFLEMGEFPRRSIFAGEEENLFYVGATRAKYRLTLLTTDNVQKQSYFIGRMGLGSALSASADNAIAKMSAEVSMSSRVDLNVPYEAKDKAKELGARWDSVRKKWYVEGNVNLADFECWIGRSNER